MHIRLSVALALVSLASATPASALVWQEAHETGADVRMRVEPNGVASIALLQRWHVVHGPLRFVDVAGVDPAAVLGPDVRVLAEDGREIVAHAARHDDRTVRVTFDDPHGVAHGTFALELPMQVDLVASQALVRDGARWRLSWSAPAASDGFDGAVARLELPAAPDPPQPVVAQTGAVDESAAATLRRGPAEDVLELERPHVSRGEAVAWSVRFDPRGMTQVTDARLRPPAEAPPKEPDRVRAVAMAAGLIGLAIAFALLVAAKSRAFRAACAERTARSRALLPLPDAARAALAGAALAAAVGLEAADATWAAALCIALATLATSLRAPVALPAVRGPGRWLVLRPQDAFVSAQAGGSDRGACRWLDASTAAGRVAAAMAAALVAAAASSSAEFDPGAPWLVLLDAAPLLPLFVTGTSSQLPPHPARSAAPWMAAAFRRLRSVETLRVAPWARVAAQPPGPDELRLLVLPRAAMPGLVGVEIGLAWSSTPVGWTARPEVLARVLEGTPAAAKLASELPSLRLVPGRRPDERVAVLPPRYPTRRGGISLARALAGALTDRRVSYPPRVWTAPERRAPLEPSSSPASDAA
jgi:hypothetical protein